MPLQQLHYQVLLYQQRYVPRKQLAFHHKLDVSDERCIQTIMEISWCDHVANYEVLKRAMLQPLSDTVKVRRLNLGHILCLYQRKGRQV